MPFGRWPFSACGASPSSPGCGMNPGGTGIPNRLKNSSICSFWGFVPRGDVVTFSVVRMFTTEGPTRSTSTVKSGKPDTNIGRSVASAVWATVCSIPRSNAVSGRCDETAAAATVLGTLNCATAHVAPTDTTTAATSHLSPTRGLCAGCADMA